MKKKSKRIRKGSNENVYSVLKGCSLTLEDCTDTNYKLIKFSMSKDTCVSPKIEKITISFPSIAMKIIENVVEKLEATQDNKEPEDKTVKELKGVKIEIL